MRPFRLERRCPLRQQVLDRRNHMSQLAPRVGRHLVEARGQLGAGNQHRRVRIAQDVSIVGRLPQRVQRHRHGTGLDRAKEAVDEGRTIEEQQEDPLLGPDLEPLAQRRGEPVHVLEYIRVADARVAAFNGHRSAAPFSQMAIDEIGGGVERFGNAE